MVDLEQQLSLASANLNSAAAILSSIKDSVDQGGIQLAVEGYFKVLLALDQIKQTMGNLERVIQKDSDSE